VYVTTRGIMKDKRKTTKYQLLGASRYCIHVSMKNTPNCEMNLHHLLIVRVDVLTIHVLLPHPIGSPELRVEICIYRVDV